MGRVVSIRMSGMAGVCLAAGAWMLSMPAAAQEWKPFPEPEYRRPPRAAAAESQVARPPVLAPMDGGPGRYPSPPPSAEPLQRPSDSAPRQDPVYAPRIERAAPIERSELPPVMAADGSGLPHELWRGLDAAQFEKLIAALDLPPRSPALHSLWRRLLAADPGLGTGDENSRRFLAVRAESLRRTGLIADEAKLLDSAGDGQGAVIGALRARARIALGDADAGCPLVKASVAQRAELPAPLKTELVLLSGYCAGAAGSAAAAGLAADLARDEGIDAPFGLALLDAISAGAKVQPLLPKQVGPTDYRLMQLGAAPSPQLVERAVPALLAVLATTTNGPPQMRVAAAEAGTRVNAVTPDELADAWRAEPFQPQELAEALTARVDPAVRRALLFRAAETERTPLKKTRVIRALLDDSRRAGLYLATLTLMSKQVETLTPAEEIGWFAETAVEAHLAAGAFDRARAWIAFTERLNGPAGGTALQHWLALADIADVRPNGPRGAMLGSVEAMALRGRFPADLLHRLATVLDALDYNVPIPLWEAASRTPQPSTGHLPPTGVLTELQDAAKKGEFGRTVLLAMQALGPNGGEGAHMIALGDSIRALRRARLEPEARRLAFEALFAGWPRASVN